MVDFFSDFPAGITFSDIATKDTTGTVTGLTTGEFENYATKDYRLKTSSSGFGAFPALAPSDDQLVSTSFTLPSVKAFIISNTALNTQLSNSTFSLNTTKDSVITTSANNTQTVTSGFVANVFLLVVL